MGRVFAWLMFSGLLFTGLACGSRAPVTEVPVVRREFEHAAMGTRFRLTLFAVDVASAEAAAALALARIDAIEVVATDYDATSEARRLSTMAVGEWTPVSADLALVLRASDAAVHTSGGAFDPTVGALTRLWRRALRTGEWPDQTRWDEARRHCGWLQLVELREMEGQLQVRLGSDEMRLDFGGVAKGVAVDEALVALAAAGIHSALVDGGGDLAASAAPPGEPGWRVAVRPLDAGAESRFLLVNAAIATSGDRFQRGLLSGPPLHGTQGAATQYGHVLDPRTGLPLPAPRAAVMTAGSAAVADALATARLVLGATVTASPHLERGQFFGPEETEACAGSTFPHDGVTPIDRAAAVDR